MHNYDIVCIGPHSWSKGVGGQIWRRRHHLMTNFAKRHRVLFIETAYFSPFGFASVVSPFFKGSFLRKVWNNLWVLTLYSPLPFQETALRKGVNIVKRINDGACLYQIKKALKELEIKNKFLLWAYYSPQTACFLKELQANFIVCDVYDKYTEYATVDAWQREYISNQEKEIFNHSNLVFTASESLLRYCREYKQECYLVPNGVDEIFCSVNAQIDKPPDDLKSIPAPRIGYIGSVFDKLDYELLVKVGKLCKNYSFVFIGPVRVISNLKTRYLNELGRLHNVYFLGPKPITELPQYYKGLDICIVPYDRVFAQVKWADEWCKLWECVAAGKPIIINDSTLDVLEQREPAIQQIINVARNHEDFIDKIESCLKKDHVCNKEINIKLAKEHTWPKKVCAMEKIIETYWKGC